MLCRRCFLIGSYLAQLALEFDDLGNGLVHTYVATALKGDLLVHFVDYHYGNDECLKGVVKDKHSFHGNDYNHTDSIYLFAARFWDENA